MIASEWEMFCRLTLALEAIAQEAEKAGATLEAMAPSLDRMAEASEESNRLLQQCAQQSPGWSLPIGPLRS